MIYRENPEKIPVFGREKNPRKCVPPGQSRQAYSYVNSQQAPVTAITLSAFSIFSKKVKIHALFCVQRTCEIVRNPTSDTEQHSDF